MRFTSLSSGSRQNAYLVKTEDSLILIDCGMSFKKLKTLVADAGEDLKDLRAVILTHDHLDHVRGLKTLVKKIQVPVFAHPKIHSRLQGHPHLHVFDFSPDQDLKIDDIVISARIIPHDATLTQGFRLTAGGRSLVLLTDLGYFPEKHTEWAFNPHLLAIEANYDPNMLAQSFYPEKLKKRVSGSHGHLSNEDSLNVIRTLAGDCLKQVCFLHLSENNNHPDNILKLLEKQSDELFQRLKFYIAHRTEILPWIEV